MLLMPVAFAALLQLTSCRGRETPESLFREVVLNPIPASVRIISASRHSTSGDVAVWLNFKISRDDFNAIWKADPYQSFPLSQLNYSAYGPPVWWSPEQLGATRSDFGCETKPYFGRDRSAKDMIVNQQEDEVFFLLRSWYNH